MFMSENEHINNQQSPNKSDGPRQPIEVEAFYQMLGRLLAQRWKRECEQADNSKNS